MARLSYWMGAMAGMGEGVLQCLAGLPPPPLGSLDPPVMRCHQRGRYVLVHVFVIRRFVFRFLVNVKPAVICCKQLLAGHCLIVEFVAFNRRKHKTGQTSPGPKNDNSCLTLLVSRCYICCPSVAYADGLGFSFPLRIKFF